MSEELGALCKKLEKEVSAKYKEIQSRQAFMDQLRKECQHSFKYDYTCGHKGEDYYTCEWCGERH